MTHAAQRSEVDRNYDFFQRNLSTVLAQHEGRYALLKAAKFEGFFDKPGDAYREGIVRFPDKLFSIQQITREPLDLGFFSHAGAWLSDCSQAVSSTDRNPTTRYTHRH